MAAVIDADYSTQWLFPPSLEELVPQDHPARFIREFVQTLDLPSLGLVDPPCLDGRPPYAKALLLKIWLYGYFHNIRSHRKLERACREHLSLLWLTGMHQPDHNSLWRFWNEHRQAIRKVYAQSVRLALKAQIVSLALLALDGTKIAAAASSRTGWTQSHMKRLLAALEESLDERETQIAQNAQQEAGEYRLPESLSERQALQAAVKAGLSELAASERKHYHPQEPEAHRMKCGGTNQYAYNAQAVADEKTGIILACAVTGQENDSGQLPVMLEQAREMVQEPGPAEAVTLKAVADTGYGAGADLAAAHAAGFDVVTPLPEGKPSKNNPYHASQFAYDAQTDQCRCPQGQALRFERKKNRRGTPIRIYRCRNVDCPVRALCTRDKRGRTIEIADHYEHVVAMRQKLATAEGKSRLRQRGRIIEPRFAEVKVGQAFRRWTVRGLEKVSAQWHWICATVNLKVLFRSWVTGALKLA